MHNIYPDLSNDQFDIKYVKRKILASDIFAHDVLQNALAPPGIVGVAPPREIPDIPFVANPLPADEEYTVTVGGGNTMNVEEGNPIVKIPHFIGNNLRNYRNNIPQIAGTNYSWNRKLGEYKAVIAPVEGEIFTFQAYAGVPDPETYEVNSSGENINNITVDNSIVFLTNFVTYRVRIFRNNILMSFKTDFTWNANTGKLELTVAPVLEETFIINGY